MPTLCAQKSLSALSHCCVPNSHSTAAALSRRTGGKQLCPSSAVTVWRPWVTAPAPESRQSLLPESCPQLHPTPDQAPLTLCPSSQGAALRPSPLAPSTHSASCPKAGGKGDGGAAKAPAGRGKSRAAKGRAFASCRVGRECRRLPLPSHSLLLSRDAFLAAPPPRLLHFICCPFCFLQMPQCCVTPSHKSCGAESAAPNRAGPSERLS